ncbi:MAG: hypothetical protein ACFFCS_18500 [Candidatus Hodarchaeota archaeon]
MTTENLFHKFVQSLILDEKRIEAELSDLDEKLYLVKNFCEILEECKNRLETRISKSKKKKSMIVEQIELFS